ncbi:hypothetical protein TNCV_1348211 [Trichonephila clavipes]|nr:hypothetical protein TNCV_1348211 [Trichonephila clavipes]
MKGNASASVREIRRRKNLLREPMSTKGIRFVNFVVERSHGVDLCLLKISGQLIRDFKRRGNQEFNQEEAVNVLHRYLFKLSMQLLTNSHRHQDFGAVALVQFLDRQAILTAQSERYSET